MSFLDWLPAISTAAAIGFALWLSRKLILTRLANSVRHEFDVKLEQLRSDLHDREREIRGVRETALSALTTAKSAIDQRRIEAIDQVWQGLIEARADVMAVHLVGILKLNNIARSISDPRLQQFMETITGLANSSTDAKRKEEIRKVERARPWISPMAWALYTAYLAIVHTSVIRLSATNAGIENADDLVNKAAAAEMLSAALPDRNIQEDNFPDSLLPDLVKELEEKLLHELQESAIRIESDEETVKTATRIANLSKDLMSDEDSD